ncbi:MAG: NAD-glutamate dehydrogenase [Rhizobiaceae bacterium]
MANRGRNGSAKGAKTQLEHFSELLFNRAPEEDVSRYDRKSLALTAEHAFRATKQHRKNKSVVVVDNDTNVRCDGRPVTIITVVNDNMPFLFDSIIGAITAEMGEPSLVLHPVIEVVHGRAGITEFTGKATPGVKREGFDSISVMHVHTAAMPAENSRQIADALEEILKQVRATVNDWRPMLARLERMITDYRYNPPPLKSETLEEAVAFLEWLRDDNFTFLGMREYRYTGSGSTGKLKHTDKPSLGILSDPDVRILRKGDEALSTTPEIRAFMDGPEPLLVTKANTKSKVHRQIYMDYIGVKIFNNRGKLSGELRIVGLFTSTAYTRSVMNIPYLRSKAKAVITSLGHDPAGHLGKALINVLESYPRDELFQIDLPKLTKNAEAILALSERPRVRALIRADQFDRFVSAIVYVPRDRYNSRNRERIGDYLKQIFQGRLSAYYPAFPEGGLARVHFIIGRNAGQTPFVPQAEIERNIRAIIRNWDDALAQAAADAGADRSLVHVALQFPADYRESFPAEEALGDAERIRTVSADMPIAIDFYRATDQADTGAALKIYHFGTPVSLSRRVPLLENMGFKVISERTFDIAGNGDTPVFLHAMQLVSADGRPIELSDDGALFDELFLSVWNGENDNDGYNALAHAAGLRAGEITILRAYGRYLQQAGIPQSQEFIADVLSRYPEISRNLHALFCARFDPGRQKQADSECEKLRASITEALESVPSLDEDTILRRFLNLVNATLRTNHFAPPATDLPRSLAFKLEPRRIDGLPEPRPWREIFVYGAEVEGVHLRFGPVARGGLRWSDRAQDYRTEILGLAKAQQVKNAVIVPVGAKGGFFPKRLPAGGSRDEVFQAGRQAYMNFIASLLSVTDNLDGARVKAPAGVVRRDGDDPYFVVAADKGTATFSDTANGISQAHGFWLDDAFASGGSAGYDHKKMGITARGAWEAVKRHFREMDRDIQNEDFTAVGVGDMSGDVFGNGMLLSRHTRLLAAFDHRDIFIDPDPDPAGSFVERQRLFDLGRSSWQDYDTSKLSKGGMIVSRATKSIKLSPEAAALLDFSDTSASPQQIMRAILRCKADLLWFGGIGTYVRAKSESNQDAGDRANDAIRITAAEVGAKVIGEGANLGVTQRARIEYGLAGGRCNSDAIDNSAGVNSSDVEVNIKIALAAAMRGDKLARPARDKLLARMTDDVARLVLTNNYRQTLALSLSERRGLADMGHQGRFMKALEERGLLDRAVELLPDDTEFAERQARGEALSRAELGVLLAYAKIVLFDELVASDLPDDPHFAGDLSGYFPDQMAKKFADEISHHRLRREIVATLLANDAINRGGPAFISRLQDLSGRSSADILSAFVLVRDGFELGRLYADIDALDNKVPGATQLEFYAEAGRIVHGATGWFLRQAEDGRPLGEKVESIRRARGELEPKLAAMMPDFMSETLLARQAGCEAAGAPTDLARRLALLGSSDVIPDAVIVAERADTGLTTAAQAYFGVTEHFRISRIAEAARSIAVTDYYDGLALARANEMIASARRRIAVEALKAAGKAADPVGHWLENGGSGAARAGERMRELIDGGDITLSRLTVAAGLMNDLAGQDV